VTGGMPSLHAISCGPRDLRGLAAMKVAVAG
jgi:hypothetical protein